VRVLEASERKTWLAITLAEGKNRQVRRMCDAVGLPVEKLIRVALGPLTLGKLPTGAWRHLDADELAALQGATRHGPARRRPTRGHAGPVPAAAPGGGAKRRRARDGAPTRSR
jgi:23S rRNA pseudouridine2605 synthase